MLSDKYRKDIYTIQLIFLITGLLMIVLLAVLYSGDFRLWN